MKLLIAYDGSECSDAAIMDLRCAGLPPVADVLILSVAEVSQRVTAAPYGALVVGAAMFVPQDTETDASTDHHLQDAKAFAAQATDRLRADFPNWHIDAEAWLDAAGSAIIRKVHVWQPDLVVLGSHGRSGIDRFLLGSVSQHVLHHVTCSVRISRHHLYPQEQPIRLLIGVDGSNGARMAVQSVAARKWPANTAARVIGVLDSGIALAAANSFEGAIPVEIEEEFRIRMSKAVHAAVQELETSGLHVTHQILTGIPCEALLAEAEKWPADSLFVGARGLNGLERLLLGSVSTAVASHAHCSVEIVR
jgi:nucleotide-binding universal stress UspA family protein